ncbi:glycosyltransferase family 4 protein [Salisediminibacterium selenitireducens]|uniref:Glycosyl transferase, family 4, conserved region n=1 Tax=Bacillus selenitireducens (strain ATCC 700615 / DSM 15326 / MLS10) TaxID=439292 RepID=D6Y044_BACIE|nr:MraY family glycosyltransferase [Salisediminibacterium selenitireducens]ADI00546.1 Glycosyl transferase, family 4, conserved region [[Bacillus] selenitireducens MLS10]
MDIIALAVTFALAFFTSLAITPLVIKLAFKLNFVDHPGQRRVHQKATPRLGGLGIFIAFLAGLSYALTQIELPLGILAGALIIVVTGLLDDRFSIRPIQKLFGQSIAAVFVLIDGPIINTLTVPFSDSAIVISPYIAVPIAFIWILGITNAVNLIDGLDGLAGGVSLIAALSIFTMAIMTGNMAVAFMVIALAGGLLGFLFFNFHPAKIFMGDSGSLLLGYLLAVFSVISFKQVTFVTLIIPIIILAVPIVDTMIAIIRRKLNNKRIMEADKHHLHHKLLAMGFSHRATVLFIYMIAAFFGIAAVLFYTSGLLGSTIIFLFCLLMTELMIEKLQLINTKYRPVLATLNRVRAATVTGERNR